MSLAYRLNADEIVWGVLFLVGIATVLGLRRLDGAAATAPRRAFESLGRAGT